MSSGKIEKKSKYGNKKQTYKGMVFDSKAELNFYLACEKFFKEGLENINRQVKFELSNAKIGYIADFSIGPGIYRIDKVGLVTAPKFYVDVKGFKTKDFAIKMRLWKAYTNEALFLINYSQRSIEHYNATDKEAAIVIAVIQSMTGIDFKAIKEIRANRRALNKKLKGMTK